ncbi:MAG TPA: hypothetical protein VHB79_04905 [Polyangiaceae bacterium]|nr:hypothetical protein [Polyangiaceae bacterium]
MAFGVAAMGGVLAVVSCGSSDDGGTGSNGGTNATSAGAGGEDAGSGGLDVAGSLNTSGSVNAGGDHSAGNCPGGCSGGQICLKGSCECPSYQSLCDGKCVPTAADPGNCGKCGNECTGATACSAGECSTSCSAPLTLCKSDHSCTDTENDNDHCGGCDKKCDPGQGCVKGRCVDSVPLGDPPAKCSNGGPPIVNSPDMGGCLGNLAATTFRWTLCSCKDVQLSDYILVDAFDSTKGPYQPGSTGGGVGANEKYHASGASVPPKAGIYGDLWASSTQGINDSADELVKNILKSGGSLQSSATMTVEGDVYANGDVPKGVEIGGNLHVPADAKVGVTPAGKVVRGAVSFPPPCDCAEKQLVPITAMVEAHAGTNNDNAAVGLDPDVLASPKAPTRLDLPCGSYYLSSIHPSVGVTIWAHGHVALYIGEDVQSSDDISFGVDATGSFDVFIAGKLGASAGLTIGSPNYPALTRTYIGSTTGVSLSSAAYISGNIYAAYGQVHWSASTDAYGSVFAGDFDASAPTRIHYDRAVLNQGDGCGGGGGTGGDSGSGGGGNTCESCRDCGNQACHDGECGACTSNADCCAPLGCDQGACVPIVK